MYFETTSENPLKFAAHDLTEEDAEILANALIEIKTNRFADATKFDHLRTKCVEMYTHIDRELIAARNRRYAAETEQTPWEKRHVEYKLNNLNYDRID